MGDCEIGPSASSKDESGSLSPSSSGPVKTWNIEEVSVPIEMSSNVNLKSSQKSLEPTDGSDKTESTLQIGDDYQKLNGKEYCKAEIQPLVLHKTDFEKPSVSSKRNHRTSTENLTEDIILLEDETVISAYAALFFSCFNLFWSCLVAYWHVHSGRFLEAALTVLIIFIGGIVVEIFYLFNKKIQLKQIWKTSTMLYICNLIPCFTSILLSLSNAVFAVKESRCKTYKRPWYRTRVIFLTEALAFAFPQCILQSIILIEDKDSIPSIKGFFLFFGLCVLTVGIAFARIRYDCATKYERFGQGIEKWLRFLTVWANKVLWLIAMCVFLIILRLRFPNHLTMVTVGGFVGLQIFYEVQVLLSAVSGLRDYYGNSLGLLFIIPQFTSIICLIMWVNTDFSIYETYVGCLVLGVYFCVEFICLLGWLLDGCREKDIEYISMYPHFFGNVFSYWYK